MVCALWMPRCSLLAAQQCMAALTKPAPATRAGGALTVASTTTTSASPNIHTQGNSYASSSRCLANDVQGTLLVACMEAERAQAPPNGPPVRTAVQVRRARIFVCVWMSMPLLVCWMCMHVCATVHVCAWQMLLTASMMLNLDERKGGGGGGRAGARHLPPAHARAAHASPSTCLAKELGLGALVCGLVTLPHLPNLANHNICPCRTAAAARATGGLWLLHAVEPHHPARSSGARKG